MNSKKQKRLESKKRKIEAFLDLVYSNDVIRSPDTQAAKKLRYSQEIVSNSEVSLPKAQLNSEELTTSSAQISQRNIGNRLEALRKITERRKRNLEYPLFHLSSNGKYAQVRLHEGEEEQKEGEKLSLLFEDVKRLLLFSLMGYRSPLHCDNWCTIHRIRKISHVVLLCVDGVSVNDFKVYSENFTKVKNIFKNAVQILSPSVYGMSIPKELSLVHISKTALQKLQKTDGKVQEAIKNHEIFELCQVVIPAYVESVQNVSKHHGCTKTDLLLSPLQLIEEGYPMPFGDKRNRCENYVYTKDTYVEVTQNSPMFSVDCEMCLTTSGENEVTRITMVDEKLQVLYDTLVKPDNPIVNYLTKFSGITEDLLKPIKTTLRDVQQNIREILPSDAILCGQSLNNDLHALKMIHPYIIDSSVVYNLSGIRAKKPSLKSLCDYFLNESIQDSPDGHCSIEDSRACMKLIQLKLNKSVEFGDASLGLNPWENVTNHSHSDSDCNITQGRDLMLNKTGLAKSTFSELINVGKTVCIVGSQSVINDYPPYVLPKSVHIASLDKGKDVYRTTANKAMQYNLTISHLNASSLARESAPRTKLLNKVDKAIDHVFSKCAEKCLFIVVLNGENSRESSSISTKSHGLCMVKIKRNSKQSL